MAAPMTDFGAHQSDRDAPDNGFDQAFDQLKQLVESAHAGRAKLSVTQYEGPGGVRVVCQEAFHHNFDLTHEHWAEVVAPSDEAAFGGEVFRRTGETLAFVHVLLTGDKAAGKTTFINGLTTGDLRILQCLRYESGLFYNIWYAPSTADITSLRGSLMDRSLPFFQTELAHGGMLMDAPELRFFLEDEEFDEGQGIPAETQEVLDGARHVLVKLLELGGDFLHELLEFEEHMGSPNSSAHHPVKAALLNQSAAAVRVAAKAAYFVNLSSLFEVCTGPCRKIGADATGPAVLVDRLRFLRRLLRDEAEVLLFCTREPEIDLETAMSIVGTALHVQPTELPELHLGDVSRGLLKMVEWLAMRAGFSFERLKVFPAEHLSCDTGDIDHTAVLRSLRRLLSGDALATPKSALPLLSEQVAQLFFTRQLAIIDKEALAELLEDFDDDGHAELYRKVLHPMVVLPPMVLLDSFGPIMSYLSSRGFICPADGNGHVPLEVEVVAEGVVRARLCTHALADVCHAPAKDVDSVAPRSEQLLKDCVLVDSSTVASSDRITESTCADVLPPCWRVLAQQSAVAEARRILNLFQLEDSQCAIPAAAALAILTEAWSITVAAWESMPAAEAFSELYLAARFLLSSKHEALPADCGYAVEWDDTPWSQEQPTVASTFDNVGCIVLRVPNDVASTCPWRAGMGWTPDASGAKRLRTGMC